MTHSYKGVDIEYCNILNVYVIKLPVDDTFFYEEVATLKIAKQSIDHYLRMVGEDK